MLNDGLRYLIAIAIMYNCSFLCVYIRTSCTCAHGSFVYAMPHYARCWWTILHGNYTRAHPYICISALLYIWMYSYAYICIDTYTDTSTHVSAEYCKVCHSHGAVNDEPCTRNLHIAVPFVNHWSYSPVSFNTFHWWTNDSMPKNTITRQYSVVFRGQLLGEQSCDLRGTNTRC